MSVALYPLRGYPAWDTAERTRLILPRNGLLAEFKTEDTKRALSGLDSAGLLRRFPFHTNTEPLRDGMVLYITSRCNCHCAYCEASIGSPADDMTSEVAGAAFELAGYAARHMPERPYSITFLGGEPTLRTDLVVGIMERFRLARIGLTASLCTNGMLAEPELRRLLRYDNLLWRVSMDIPDSRYASVDYRTGCDYKRVESVVRTLTAAGRNPMIRATVTKNTLPLMGELAEKLEGMGVRRVTFTPMRLEYGRSVELPDAQPDMAEYTNRWYAVRRGHPGIELSDSHLDMLFGKDTPYCSNIFIMPDGTVLPTTCESYAQKNLRAGSVLDRNWAETEKRLNELKAGYMRDVEIHCADCIGRHICGGGCKSTAFYLGVPARKRECDALFHMIAFACERVDALISVSDSVTGAGVPTDISLYDYKSLKNRI